MICSGKERFFADLFATRRRRIKSELTQHPFPDMDRLLEKARSTTSGLFRFLGFVSPLHRDPMPCTNAITVEAPCSHITFVHSKNAPDLGRFFDLDKQYE